MTNATHASTSFSHETKASPATIWEIFKAVSEWKDWNAGVHACTLEGPFATGSWFTMVLPDQDVIRSEVVEVEEPNFFTDETKLGDIVVRVRHEISPVPNERHCVTYKIEVIGENAGDICAAVSSDFPEVLKALVSRAENRMAE
ncbi:SRPBCC family protein [Herbaspirillum rhizosphaerae]|uniref:SRPBCC family protein n=1 Tax=Herbaspirillum rhizosphaerae TaxID=346179 RepID=UPI00067B302E|nr:SRPBCC family protein [Herbaspirillum rhizosphaerae]